MATWTLSIPKWHPTPLNQLVGCHYGTRSRRKRADRQLVGAYVLAARIPAAVGKRRVSMTITLRPGQRAPDPDGLWKSLLDALVACGALVDDNRQGVELGPVTFDRGTAGAWGVEIRLDDVPAPVARRLKKRPVSATMGRGGRRR